MENPGDLIDMADRWRVRVDAGTKAAVCFADVVQEGQSGKASAGDVVKTGSVGRFCEAPAQGRRGHQGCDIGGVVDERMPSDNRARGIPAELGPERLG